MELLIAAVVAGGFLTLTAHLVRRSRRARVAERPRGLLEEGQAPRGWDELRPQDVLLYDGRDLIVREVLMHDESGRLWQECRLDDDGATWWLRIEGDEGAALVLGQPVEPLVLGDQPPASLDHEGKIYQLDRQGQSLLRRGDQAAGEVRFWNYRRAGRDCFWLRQRGDDWLHVAGERVERHLVELLPGS